MHKICLLHKTAHVASAEFTRSNKLKRHKKNKKAHSCTHCLNGTLHNFPNVKDLVVAS